MVKACCVKSCKVVWSPNADLSFFAFPFNNEEMKEKWINASPTSYATLSKHSSICHNHFWAHDYSTYAGRRILKKNAVPSIFGHPRCPNGCNNTPHIHAMNMEECSSSSEIDVELEGITLLRSETQCDAMTQISPSTLAELEKDKKLGKKFSDIFVQTCPRLSGPSDREKELQHKIRILQERLRRREKAIKNVKALLAHSKKYAQSSYLEDKFFKKFTPFDIELFKNQANNNDKAKNTKTYTKEMKEFAKTLYSYSPRAYKFVRAKINLPHTATLRRWIAESAARTKQNEIGNKEAESNETEKVESIETEEVEPNETEEVEYTEMEELETSEMEELQPIEIEESRTIEIEDVEYTEMDGFESTDCEAEEFKPTETEAADYTEMEEIESFKIEEENSFEIEEENSLEIEEVESTEMEEVASVEIEKIKSIEMEAAKSDEKKTNQVPSGFPVLITLPASVVKSHAYHGSLTRPGMKAIPILVTKRAFSSVKLAQKH